MLLYISILVAVSLAGASPAIQPIHAVTSANRNSLDLDERIVGGTTADIRSFPHQISLRRNGNHICGGSIYKSNIIITAAHCVQGEDSKRLSVAAGSSIITSAQQEINVEKYVIHENYNSQTTDYDIAILKLSSNLAFNSNVQPIALAISRPRSGSQVTVTGWGRTSEGGSNSNQLRQVTVNVVSNADCSALYRNYIISNRMLCAGVDAGGKDSCQNDSGGPLISSNRLLGIVSWGVGCARQGNPGVYTSIPNVRSWIDTALKYYI